VKVDIKSLSVNDAWKGRRFRSDKYKAYKRELLLKLKPLKIPEGEIYLKVTVGFSSKGSDLDNILKPLQDILSEYYGFNDNKIYVLHVVKEIVKKGDDFIDFEILPLSALALDVCP